MNWIKRSLAIPLASSGASHFEQGEFRKSANRLHRAFEWGPSILKGTVFEGYYGLALVRVGSHELAIEHLESARIGISACPSEDSETARAESRVLKDIESVLNNGDT